MPDGPVFRFQWWVNCIYSCFLCSICWHLCWWLQASQYVDLLDASCSSSVPSELAFGHSASWAVCLLSSQGGRGMVVVVVMRLYGFQALCFHVSNGCNWLCGPVDGTCRWDPAVEVAVGCLCPTSVTKKCLGIPHGGLGCETSKNLNTVLCLGGGQWSWTRQACAQAPSMMDACTSLDGVGQISGLWWNTGEEQPLLH